MEIKVVITLLKKEVPAILYIHIMHILLYIIYLVAVYASGGVVEATFAGGFCPWHAGGGLSIG